LPAAQMSPPAERPTKRAFDILLALATLASLPAFARELYTLARAHSYAAIIGYAVFFLALGAVAIIRIYPRRGPSFPETKVFRPFLTPDDDDTVFVPRATEEEALWSLLTRNAVSPTDRILFLIGESGVGKSSLVSLALRDRASDRANHLPAMSIDHDLRSELADRRARPNSVPAHDILVVDQFEQFVAAAATDLTPAHKLETLAQLILELFGESPEYRLIIIVRPEWIWQLRHLGDLAPTASNTLAVGGFERDSVGEIEKIMSKFIKVGVEVSVVAEVLEDLTNDNRISPVQLEIVGAMIEVEAKDARVPRDKEWYRGTLISASHAMAKYRDIAIKSAKDRRVAAKIMLALSTRTRFRVRRSDDELRARLFENDAVIKECLENLKGTKVVRVDDGGKAELAHDFLASLVQGMSSDATTPRERDNVLFHFEPNRSGKLSRALTPERRRRKLIGPFGAFEATCLVIGLIMVCGRSLAYQAWPHIGPVRYLPESWGSLPQLDVAYLPIGLVHYAWLYYLSSIYARVFGHLQEWFLQRVLSVGILISGLLGIFVGTLSPTTWIIDLGVVGLILGLKLLALGCSSRISPGSRKEVRGIGWRTSLNLIIIGLAGVAADHFWRSHMSQGYWPTLFAAQSAAAAGALLYGVLLLMPVHASQAATSEMLGLLGRRDEVVIIDVV
jgi:hypothetical protein